MIKSEDEAAAQAAHQAAASGNFMHVGSSARLLSRSPHNNNTLHGEQPLLYFICFFLSNFNWLKISFSRQKSNVIIVCCNDKLSWMMSCSWLFTNRLSATR